MGRVGSRQTMAIRRTRAALVLAGLLTGAVAVALVLERLPSQRNAGRRNEAQTFTHDPILLEPAQRDEVVHTFRIRNRSGQILRLSIGSKSCGCIDPTLSKTVLKAGELGQLTVRVPIVGRRYTAAEWVIVRMVPENGEPRNQRYRVEVPVFPRIWLRLPEYPGHRITLPEGHTTKETPIELLVCYRSSEGPPQGTPSVQGQGIEVVFFRPPGVEAESADQGIYCLVWRGRLCVQMGESAGEIRTLRYAFGPWSGEAHLRVVRHSEFLFTPGTVVFGRSASPGYQRPVWLLAHGATFTLDGIDAPAWLEVTFDPAATDQPQRRIKLRLRLLERPQPGQYEVRARLRRPGTDRTETVTLSLVFP